MASKKTALKRRKREAKKAEEAQNAALQAPPIHPSIIDAIQNGQARRPPRLPFPVRQTPQDGFGGRVPKENP